MGIIPSKQETADFETVYEKYYDRVYKYAYTLLLNREDAEDVTSETFLAAYTHFAGYDPAKASVVTWLTRIAHNKAVNLVRAPARSKRSEMPEEWDPADEGPDFTEQIGTSDAVVQLYARLTPEEREFLNLRYVMELKDREIAALMGLPEKTVNKRYQRLLARCRTMMGGEAALR